MKKFGESYQEATDHFSERRTTKVIFNGELVRCSDVEKALGLYQGAMNNRRRRKGGTYQDICSFYLERQLAA